MQARRKPKSHCTVDLPEAWINVLTEFTANQIPIRLIDLKTFRFVSRSDVAQHCRPILAAYVAKNPSMYYCSSRRKVRRALVKVVKYAIFSHRWLANGEPTFRDIDLVSKLARGPIQDDRVVLPDATTLAGLDKFLSFCAKARSHGCRFAWSDTCCINKDSSTELDETIRSMFQWYRNAYICIAHLAGSLVLDDISTDEWFKRGWTLQELLAPEKIKFYNREWKAFTKARNDKDRRNGETLGDEVDRLWQAVLAATHIPPSEISFFRPGTFNVAQRLSWMADRRTTRIEDRAYALMGIFDIHIAVQYGERNFAFQRLMEALLLRVRGIDIFSWTGPSSRYSLALPASIEGYRDVKQAEDRDVEDLALIRLDGPSMMLTHKGLQLEVLLVPMVFGGARGIGPVSWTYSISLTEWSSGASEPSDEETETSSEEQSSEYERAYCNDGNYIVGPADGAGEYGSICLVDPNDIFEPLGASFVYMVHADGSRVSQHSAGFEYSIAILDYGRDEERGSRGATVPHSGRSRYLAFVLGKKPEKTGWWKSETERLVFVEVKAGKQYKGEVVSIYL